MTLLDIFTHYGYTNQTAQLAEECGELVQAVNKYGRKAHKANANAVAFLRKNIVEEIADVMVMIRQFMDYLQITDEEVETVCQEKLERQAKRVDSERDKKHETL